MKKPTLLKALSAFLTLVFILTAVLAIIPTANGATKSVSFTTPAIPADVGETVDLSAYGVELTQGNLYEPDSISWSSSEITVSGNKVTPATKGVYKLTASKNSVSKTVYLVVKAADESEYVLYSNDFSDASRINEFTVASGSQGSIADGKLSMSASTKLLLPDWLGDFGDYDITADAAMTTATNDRRWMSVMYRYQSSSSYYQMAVRQNASQSDGVEIARMTSANGWDVRSKTSYTNALDPNTYYTFSISVYGSRVEQYLSGKNGGSLNTMTELKTGKIGIQTDSCTAKIDSIKVCARFEGLEEPAIATTRKLTSGITLAPAMIYEVTSAEELSSILTNSPAVAIMTLNADGSIIDAEGKVISTLTKAVSTLNGKVVPALRPTSDCTAKAAAEHIRTAKLKDVMIVSDSKQFISSIRNISNLMCVLDLSGAELKDTKLWEIRAEVLSVGARACILPYSMATQKNTEALNTMGVSVWYGAAKSTQVEMLTLITSGANGIITLDRKLMEDTLASPIFKQNSIIRPIGTIGHRGTPALAPELTIEGSSLAAVNGANIIENDVYITSDGVVAVMHDADIKTITNGSGNIESMTYEELMQYQITDAPDISNSSNGNIIPPLPIASLEDYFKCFKGSDTFLFIEIKSGQAERIAVAIKELIEKYDMEAQCGVISFRSEAIRAIRKHIPEISVGWLIDSSMSLDNILVNVSDMNSSYNAHSNLTNAELVRELAARGIFTWPWTVNDSGTFDKFWLMGVGGVTTDHSYYAKDYIRFLLPEKSEITVTAGEYSQFKVMAEKYSADWTDPTFANITKVASNAEMLIVSGNDSLQFASGSYLGASNTGDATVIFRLEYKLNNGKSAYVYSQPVTVHVVGEGSQLPDQNNGDGNSPSSTSSQTTASSTTATAAAKGGCGSSLCATAAMLTVMTLGTTLIVKKRRER